VYVHLQYSCLHNQLCCCGGHRSMLTLPWHLWNKVFWSVNFIRWKPLLVMMYGRAQAYWAYVRFMFLYTVALRTFGTQSGLVISSIDVDAFVSSICISWRMTLSLDGILSLHLCRSLLLHLMGINSPAIGLLYAFQLMFDLFSFHAPHLLFCFTQMRFNHHIVYLSYLYFS
jgi:hypothetical protein